MADRKKKGDVAGLAFVACLMVGFGIGLLLEQTAVGLFIGLGVGFAAMALVTAKGK